MPTLFTICVSELESVLWPWRRNLFVNFTRSVMKPCDFLHSCIILIVFRDKRLPEVFIETWLKRCSDLALSRELNWKFTISCCITSADASPRNRSRSVLFHANEGISITLNTQNTFAKHSDWCSSIQINDNVSKSNRGKILTP